MTRPFTLYRLYLLAARDAYRGLSPQLSSCGGVKTFAVLSLAGMPTFVVSIRLPKAYNEAFIALVPSHRAFINHLLAEKIVEAYAISSDRRRGWITMNGNDAAAVLAVVEQFPLYRYLRGVEIDELFIFDSAASRFPRVSLN